MLVDCFGIIYKRQDLPDNSYCFARCDRTPDPTAKGTLGSRPRSDPAGSPYYSVWEFGYHRCGFGKDKC